MDIDELRRTIEVLNEKLRPIADRPVAFGRDLLERLAALPRPLDEAGIREEAQTTLEAAVDLYLLSNAEQREQIRAMFRKNHAYAWATTLPFPPDSAERMRRHLAHFSILDQYPDYRDAILWLQDLRQSPFYKAVCREIADISSDATGKLLSAR